MAQYMTIGADEPPVCGSIARADVSGSQLNRPENVASKRPPDRVATRHAGPLHSGRSRARKPLSLDAMRHRWPAVGRLDSRKPERID